MLAMHLFLIFRYYRLSRYTTASVLLAILALTACALSLEGSFVALTVTHKVSDEAELQTQVA